MFWVKIGMLKNQQEGIYKTIAKIDSKQNKSVASHSEGFITYLISIQYFFLILITLVSFYQVFHIDVYVENHPFIIYCT